MDLDDGLITNRDLLGALWHLVYYQERAAPPRRVNYAALDVEELGSVYESLLEFHPAVDLDGAGRPAFDLIKGSERKSTGSYYTPPELVAELIKSALEAVLTDRLAAVAANGREKSLLSIRVCDPACGSGHFLLAAARRLGKELARIRTSEDEPSPERVREAIRDVIRHCIYGVDKNPLAVDLCRVALWLEGHTGDRPLTFLDHRIRCGDSLVGVVDLITLTGGIPNEAFKPLEGDDKNTARMIARRNREDRKGQRDLLAWEPASELAEFTRASEAVDSIPDDTPEAVRRKRQLFEARYADTRWVRRKEACDLWTAAFFQCFQPGEPAITSSIVQDCLQASQVPPQLEALALDLAERHRFFHWPIEFPEVFEHGGFDVVLGNPPWDKIQPEEQRFFAVIRPDIASAPARERKAMIEALADLDPTSHDLWTEHKRDIAVVCRFLSTAGRLHFAGEGNLNTYRAFTETSSSLISKIGRAGLVIQSGLATDESGKELFADLMLKSRLVRFLDFENKQKFFPAVDSRFRFSLITMAGGNRRDDKGTEFGWLLHSLDEVNERGRTIRLSSDDLLLFNPASKTSPIFTSDKELDLSRHIYRRGVHVCVDSQDKLTGIDFLGELFNLTRDSKLFEARGPAIRQPVLPLYEAKYFHQFDHRFATIKNGRVVEAQSLDKSDTEFEAETAQVVAADEVFGRLAKRGILSDWLCGFRDIASGTNERTAIMTILPTAAIGNSINLVLGLRASDAACLTANVNSFVFDYCCRQKVGGTHVNIWIFKQLPAIPFNDFDKSAPWIGGTETFRDWLLRRVLELIYTSSTLTKFAHDCGFDGPPFRWNDERRFLIRCELDAAFLHCYLPADDNGKWRQIHSEPDEAFAALGRQFSKPREAAVHILEKFPIVRSGDEHRSGRYRTSECIMDAYDAMLEAQRSSKRYVSSLDPPPGTH